MTNNNMYNSIYDIKDKINDYEYSNICNNFAKLIKENKYLRQKLNISFDIDINVITNIDNYINNSDSDITKCITYSENENNNNYLDFDNYKKLCLIFPVLKNFNDANYVYIDEPIYNNYNKEYVYTILMSFIELIEKINIESEKIIFIYTMFEFIMKNINFVKDNEKFCYILYDKFNELLISPKYIKFAEEHNININNWYKHIKLIKDNFNN